MGFLDTVFLSSLAAAAIPILIHLLYRRKSRVVPFPTLQFLKALESKRIRRVKLQHILLLILRTLILALLALAFARPVVRYGEGQLSTHEQTSVVLILDTSPSTSYQTRGGTVRQAILRKAGEILSVLSDEDEVIVLSANDPEWNRDVTWGLRRDQWKVRLEHVRESFLPARMPDAVLLATRHLEKARYVNREIYVLSDLQRGALHQEGSEVSLDGATRLVYVHLAPAQVDQAAIADAAVESRIVEKDKAIELRATFSNYGRARELLANVYVEGRRMAQSNVRLEENDAVTQTFRFAVREAGFLRGHIEIDDDPLLSDNRRYFLVHVPEAVRVLLIGESPRNTNFLRLALRPNETVNRHLLVEEINASRMGAVRWTDYDVVILSQVRRLTESTARSMDEFFQTGGTLIVWPDESSDVQDYNRHLLGRLGIGQWTEWRDLQTAHVEFGRIDYTHPIVAGIFDRTQDQKMESPQFKKYFRLKGTRGRPVIEFASGEPFLAEQVVQSGLCLVFSTSLNPDESDLVYRSIFAPLLVRCVQYGFSRTAGHGTHLDFDAPLQLDASAYVQGTVTLENEEGEVARPSVVGSSTVRMPSDSKPGAYRLDIDGRTVTGVAVNLNHRESVLTPATEEELTEWIRGGVVEQVDGAEPIQKYLLQSRVGYELWRWTLAIVLILLVIEIMISQHHRWVRRPAE